MFFTSVVLFVASGASCPTMRPPLGPPVPVLFTATPSLQDAVRAVNANTERVQRLQTDTATLTIQGAPALRANLALQRPRSFRLRAQFVGVSQVLDLGSNDERFWALIDAPQFASGLPRAVYHARHDQFRASQASQFLPFQPDWLIEAFGLVQFDPAGRHEGPYSRGPGRLEIRSQVPSPDGGVTKLLVLDERYGWILEQHLYDAQGRLLASAYSSNQRYYPDSGVSLPHRVVVQLPQPNPSFQIDVQTYAVNQLYSDPAQLFAMPAFAGYQLVDLANPQSQVPPASPAPPSYLPNPPTPTGVPNPLRLPSPPNATPGQPAGTYGPPVSYPTTTYHPRYRGYTATR
jgi:hypothetical protein